MNFAIHQGNALTILESLPFGSVQCAITSPPYWGLRDYGMPDQIGLEFTPDGYVAKMRQVFRRVWDVLRDDGTLWLNLGDSYNSQPGQRKPEDEVGAKQQSNRGSNDTGSRSCPGLKPKDLVGIPWRVAFALQADGWYLRSDIIWAKPNPMPESVTDRPTKAHEYLFLLAKSEKYFYDAQAVAEPSIYAGKVVTLGDKSLSKGQAHGAGIKPSGNGAAASVMVKPTRNRRTVWTITTAPFKGAHFATFPEALVEPCILAGCPEGGTVLDPFCGTATVGVVALRHRRNFIGIELNPKYVELAQKRLAKPDQIEMGLTEATA